MAKNVLGLFENPSDVRLTHGNGVPASRYGSQATQLLGVPHQ